MSILCNLANMEEKVIYTKHVLRLNPLTVSKRLSMDGDSYFVKVNGKTQIIDTLEYEVVSLKGSLPYSGTVGVESIVEEDV